MGVGDVETTTTSPTKESKESELKESTGDAAPHDDEIESISCIDVCVLL